MSDMEPDNGRRTRVANGSPMARRVGETGAPVTGERGDDEAGVLPAGTRLAEFEITSLIGQGGFGAVYKAWDHELERVVAIKEYLPMSLTMRRADGYVVPRSESSRKTLELGMQGFINEARLLAQFDHPSLVKVYRFWQERGTTYMVMPFYAGRTLGHALSTMSGGADEAWLMQIIDGVTQALAVLHGASCYHRDIAPDNIILWEGEGRPMVPVLLDFGAARRAISDKTQAFTVILKPDYAPIEQFTGMSGMAQGAWTDVYALAAVMHLAVTGRVPPQSVARLVTDNYEPLASNAALHGRYSERLLRTIDWGLAVRPESRPQSIGELRRALGLDNASPHLPREPDGGRGKLIAIVGLVLIAVAGGAWWWGHQGAGKSIEADSLVTKAPETSASVESGPSVTAPVSPVAPALPVAPPSPQPSTRRVEPTESLAALANGATPGFVVTGTATHSVLTIGKDKLAFEVRSNREGFVYVFVLTSGNELFLLFPNLLDKYNKITPGTSLSLPRPAWPMASGGPPGTNQFVVLVSEHERDFSAAGINSNGVFPQFPLPVLAELEAARGTGPAPLLGRPVCAKDAPCKDVYGVGRFNIVEK